MFIHLIQNPDNKNDPYDLQVYEFSNKQEKSQTYYTLSGNGLTLYEGDVPVEFMSLGQWLIERDSYNHIKDFPFFKQFKSWKFMRQWKKSIKDQHRDKVRNKLVENLFILQEHFRHHLFKHRQHMLEMSNQNFIDTCYNAEARKLDQFGGAQESKRLELTKKITDTSKISRQNINDCFEKVLGGLRYRINQEILVEDTRRSDNPEPKNNVMALKKPQVNDGYNALGFPPGMTYAHRSSLRRECSRFLRFAYLADFLSLEALSKIYIGSLQIMIDRIEGLDEHVKMEEIMVMEFDDSNTTGQAQRGKEPLFYTEVTLDDADEITGDQIVDVEIDDFQPHPRGKSKIEDFDMLAHLTLD